MEQTRFVTDEWTDRQLWERQYVSPEARELILLSHVMTVVTGTELYLTGRY